MILNKYDLHDVVIREGKKVWHGAENEKAPHDVEAYGVGAVARTRPPDYPLTRWLLYHWSFDGELAEDEEVEPISFPIAGGSNRIAAPPSRNEKART